MKATILRVGLVASAALTGLQPAALGQSTFTFTVDAAHETFTYSDAERSFSGIFVKPEGKGPFPAVLVNHGQGGSPTSYSLDKARQMAAWGLVAIGPALTHAAGPNIDTSAAGSGNSSENVARGRACIAALASLAYVDTSRIAIWGHSKGAYAAIGQVAALGSQIRAAGMSAGGIVPGTVGDGATRAAPTAGEAQPTVAPFIMFHGTVDPAVSPSFSEDFRQLLAEKGVPNARHVYDTAALSASAQHNLHQTPAIDADMMAKLRAWFTTHGMFDSAPSPAPFPPPGGLYALGTARDNPATAEDERLAGIRSYDFVAGFTLRLFWRDIDDGAGHYSFAVIDEALRRTAELGQRINLEILPQPPVAVVDAATQTYVDARGEETPVPWDPALRQAHERFMAALAAHVPPGTGTRLADTPSIGAVDNSVPGFSQGIRDIDRKLRDSPFYNRTSCIEASLAAVATGRTAFPRHLGYVAFFAFDDGLGAERVDQALIRELDARYNGPDQPSLAFFIENLSDLGPLPLSTGVGTGNNLLDWSHRQGMTMMQALTSWVEPFTGSPESVASRNPATGIALAYDNYGTRFFELYVSDLDEAAGGGLDAAGHSIAEDLRQWNARLTGTAGEPPPEPPDGPWLSDADLPGFRAKVRVSGGDSPIAGTRVEPCITETLCVAGAIPGRAELFVRVVGPKPNGKLWPTLVRFSTSRIEVWIEQLGSGDVRYYDLAAASGDQLLELDGLADKAGFNP